LWSLCSWSVRPLLLYRIPRCRRKAEFMAAAVLPDAKLNYHWQMRDGSKMDKAEEIVRINGLAVQWD
ncbi:MAG: hypothetical protein AAF202_10720, partial [Pseudomonadota bacterium]